MFVNYLFRMFPFRKLYLYAPDVNLSLPDHDRVSALFECEGVLKEATFMDGAYRDIRILTITRDRWVHLGAALSMAVGLAAD